MKKKIKTILLLLLIISIALTSFSACGNKEENYFSSADELADKRISIWQGFTFEDFIKEHFPDAEYYYFGDINLMYEALNANKIDAFAYEQCFLKFADNEGLDLTQLNDLNYPTQYGYIFSDTEKGSKLLDQMNEFLAAAKKSGLLAKLQNEWFYSGETKALSEINDWDMSNGEITLSTPASQVPFHYLYEGQFSGYEAALLFEFCREYKYKLNVNVVQWDAMLADVMTGRSDIGAGCIENSQSHRETFAMCNSTFDGNFVLYVKPNPANEPKYTSDELNGKVAAAILGAIDTDVIKGLYPECRIDNYQTVNEIIYAISIGKADFGVSTLPVINDAMQKMEGITYIDECIFEQQYGAIFNKENEKAQAVLKQFNQYVSELKDSGELQTINAKWTAAPFEAELPEREYSGEKLKIAIHPSELPYSFVRDGEYVGSEMELMQGFCEKYNYIPDYLPLDFNALIVSIASEKCDLAIANVCITKERAEAVDFSESYDEAPLYIILHTKGTGSKSFTEKMKTSFYRTFVEEDRYKMFIQGIITTLEITLGSAIIGTLLGFAIYMLCRKGNRLLNGLFDVIARIMIGLPMVVVLMILYYVIFGTSNLPGAIIAVVGFSVSIALAVYSGLKVAVSSVNSGQTEGAYSLGFTDSQTFFRIILPQAMQVFFPSYKSNIIALINGTAVVGFIAVQDLTKISDLVRARTYEAFFPLIATAVVYFILGAILTAIVKRIQLNFEPEKRSKEKILKRFGKKK